jgi:hypothetical protein
MLLHLVVISRRTFFFVIAPRDVRRNSLCKKQMASTDVVDCVHRHISTLMGSGTIVSLLGMTGYFMSYEYQDHDRVEAGQHATAIHRRQKCALAIIVIASFLYISGLVLISMGVSMYRLERENIADSISGIIMQTQRMEKQPDLNEPALLSGLATALILMGVFQSLRHFHRTETWGAVGAGLYGIGWLLNAYAAACNDNTLHSVRPDRLAWTLPGASAIVIGTYLFPWALRYAYVGSPAWAIAALGYVSFGIGTSFVVSAS